MAETKLIITTNAKQVADELKQVADGLKDISKSQEEVNNVSKQAASGYEKTAGAIKETQKAQESLHMTAEEIAAWDKRARQNEMDMYTKRILVKRKYTEQELADLKKVAEETKKVGKETDELSNKVNNFAKKWGLVAVAIGIATKVFKDVAGAIADTVLGMKVLTSVSEFWNQLTYNIATGNLNMAESFRVAAKTAQAINEHREKELKDIVEVSKLRKEYNKLYFESSDLTKTDAERFDILNQAMLAHNILLAKETERIKEQLVIVRLQRENRFNSYKLKKKEAELTTQLIDIEGRAFTETKRLERQLSGLLKGFFGDVLTGTQSMRDAVQKWEDDWADERLAQQKKYHDLALKLLDDYDRSQIAVLEGKEKLEAQRNFGIKQLKEFRDQLVSLGALTDKQKEMLQVMAENIWKEYYKALAEETKDTRPTPGQQEAISKALIGDFPELEGLVRKDVAKAQKDINDIITANKAMEPVSLWNIIGLDPEDDQGKIDAIKETAKAFTDALDDILDRRVENAERTRELLDTQISETQNALEIEASLMEEGYANNVDAKRKELEKLQKQRQQALVDEEKAIKQQQAFERISQAVNIASASANILKEFTKLGPLGLALAAVAIGSLFAIWASAKTKAVSSTQLAEGGSGSETGIVTGKRHSQGGERFLDHVEVERGETWGVLSRPASSKYGEVFHDMVSSFNKDQMPSFMPATNLVSVENSGPNSRLDKVNGSINKLNDSILRQSHISQIGNKKIIRTGNKVRIIG